MRSHFASRTILSVTTSASCGARTATPWISESIDPRSGTAAAAAPCGSPAAGSLSISRVNPLPHQLEAVYEYFMKLPSVRFLAAGVAGAGKTIMADLLIRELKLRGVIERVLVVCPRKPQLPPSNGSRGRPSSRAPQTGPRPLHDRAPVLPREHAPWSRPAAARSPRVSAGPRRPGTLIAYLQQKRKWDDTEFCPTSEEGLSPAASRTAFARSRPSSTGCTARATRRPTASSVSPTTVSPAESSMC